MSFSLLVVDLGLEFIPLEPCWKFMYSDINCNKKIPHGNEIKCMFKPTCPVLPCLNVQFYVSEKYSLSIFEYFTFEFLFLYILFIIFTVVVLCPEKLLSQAKWDQNQFLNDIFYMITLFIYSNNFKAQTKQKLPS